MASLRVLLTGFGPFPGVPHNPSAWLAQALGVRAAPALADELHVRIFATEWRAATLAPDLYAALQPHVMIQFGVSQRAEAFRLERSAFNRAASRIDAAGALPVHPQICSAGPHRLDTTLPVAPLAAHLRGRGLPAIASRSAGSYLCNFLYYQALAWARAQAHTPMLLFVHIPPVSMRFTEEILLHGGEEILRFVLDHANALSIAPLSPLPPCGGTRSRDLARAEGGHSHNASSHPSPFPPCDLRELTPRKVAAESPLPQGEREFAASSSKTKGA
jgi:pyroglutamyl-peptidase